jgi:outer membrane beta-barrel protein
MHAQNTALRSISRLCNIAGAQAAKKPAPAQPAGAKDERVDISDIENKYWAPKDTDFSVVQNRTYSKEKRLAFSLMYGPLVNDTWSEGNTTKLGVNYFFSERYGVQIAYETSDYKRSETTERIIQEGASPDHGRVTGYYGVGFNWVPFYAKMSFLGKRIIYFDMSITPTLGMTTYEQQLNTLGAKDKTGFTYGVDITQWFFIHNNFAFRIDIKNRWFQEQILKFDTDAVGNEGDELRDKSTDNTLFMFGGTFFF